MTTSLSPCPDKPNCVCSESTDPRHRIAPFRIKSSAPELWQQVVHVVEELPRTRIVERSSDRLRAVCKTKWMRFRDDLELQLRTTEGLIAVRSASRLGYRDFGVNRERVEMLRSRLVARGLVWPAEPGQDDDPST